MAPRTRQRTSFDSHRFRGDREQSLYDDTFMYRPIVVERGIMLRDFPTVERYFDHLGWTTYASYSGTEGPHYEFAIGEIVREFFVNMHAIDFTAGTLRSYVRSVHIELSPDIISDFFSIPRPAHVDFEPVLDMGGPSVQTIARILTEGRVDWVGDTIPHRQLSMINRMLHLYVVNSIDPSFHLTSVSERRGRILHSIVTGRVFDLPLFMFHLIAASSDSTSRSDSMPFGLFITHYLLSLGVELPANYELLKMPNSINHVSALRSRTHSQLTPASQAAPPPVPPQPTPPPVDPYAPSSSTTPTYDLNMIGAMLASIQGESQSFHTRVYERFDALDARQAELHSFQQDMDTRLRALQTRHNEMHLTLNQVQQNLNSYAYPFGDPFGSSFFPHMSDHGDGASVHHTGGAQHGGHDGAGDGAPGTGGHDA